MFEGMLRRKQCQVCEAWKEVNNELRVQIGILNQRVSDLQDELFKRDDRLSEQYKQLVETFTGRNRPPPVNGQQIKVSGSPGKMTSREWGVKKSQLEQESREKVEMYRRKMMEAEEKGILPKVNE